MRGLGRLGAVAQHAGRREAAQQQHPFLGRARDGQRCRLGAGGEHAGVVVRASRREPSVSVRACGSSVSASAPRRTSTPWLVVPGLVGSIGSSLVLQLAAQELLRQRRALVRERRAPA